MTTQELAYTEIEKLVTNFKNIPASQHSGMNEMQTRLGLVHAVRAAALVENREKLSCLYTCRNGRQPDASDCQARLFNESIKFGLPK